MQPPPSQLLARVLINWYIALSMTDAPHNPHAADHTCRMSLTERRRYNRVERWSRPLVTPWDRISAWTSMLISDSGLIRLVYPNLHRISEDVWRSGQPTPNQLRAFARRGGRSVVSLRAGRGIGSLPLELEACSGAGLTYYNLVLRARSLPARDDLRATVHQLQIMERPILLHCLSGADRSGFAAALILMLAQNNPLTEARRQLSLRYGHNPLGKAGVLDAFFDAYELDAKLNPMPLAEWIETRYDPIRITMGFDATTLGARIENYFRRRKSLPHQGA